MMPEADSNGIPRGCLAVRVGLEEEDRRRFVVPVMYVNHPLFARLLKEAEEEYGFDQDGPINIPCHVEEFSYVKGLIDREIMSQHHGHHHHNHHHGGHHHHTHHFLCFKA